MSTMKSFNQVSQKWFPFIVLFCVAMGILFPDALGRLTPIVPFVFAFMTFVGALGSNFRHLFYVLKDPRTLIFSLVILHVVMPLIALGVGHLFFSASPDFITGMVLEYVVPSAVAAIMWSTLTGGDISLTVCILLVDTLAAPLTLPFSMRLLAGSNVKVDVSGIMVSLLWMVAVPAFLTMLANQLTHDRVGKKLKSVVGPYGKIALLVVVMLNSTRVAPFVWHLNLTEVGVMLSILVLAIIGYLLGILGAVLLHADKGKAISMTISCGMRNISAGAVIAAAYFPSEVMFPVMTATIFQQILASSFSKLLVRLLDHREEEIDSTKE